MERLFLAILIAMVVIVLSISRVYNLKQSLFHRPSCCITCVGAPDAAAVVAAPKRNECVDIGSVIGDGNASFGSALSLRLVR